MKYAKPTKGQCNGKEQKPIFGSSSKVLCREQVWIMFINMFINLHKLLVLIFKSYWIHYFVTAHRVIHISGTLNLQHEIYCQARCKYFALRNIRSLYP